MALFGAPIAHEDHAQRACYAALHLRGALRGYADELRSTRGLNFSVRMGLNSGEVVVGKIGDDLRMDYTAQGNAVIGHPTGRLSLLRERVMDDPARLRASVRSLLALDFDALVVGDGVSIREGGRERLRELVSTFPAD